MIRVVLYLRGLVKLLKQTIVLFALLFVLILKYPQLLSNCINVNRNLLLRTIKIFRKMEEGFERY